MRDPPVTRHLHASISFVYRTAATSLVIGYNVVLADQVARCSIEKCASYMRWYLVSCLVDYRTFVSLGM